MIWRRNFFVHLLAAVLLLLAGAGVVWAQTQTSGLVPCEGLEDCNWSNFLKLLGNIYAWLVRLALPLATLMIMVSGGMYMVYSTNPGKRESAKKYLLASVIGLVVVLGSYIIVATIIRFIADPSTVRKLL